MDKYYIVSGDALEGIDDILGQQAEYGSPVARIVMRDIRRDHHRFGSGDFQTKLAELIEAYEHPKK